MKNLTKYWEKQTHKNSPYFGCGTYDDWLYRIFDGRKYFAADGIYDAYLSIRKVIPYAVGAKRSLEGKPIAGSYPGYKRTYVLDPEKDTDEATEIGKRLIDTLLNYLKEVTDEPGYKKEDPI